MTYVTPTPQNMATRLGVQVDVARATAVITDAETLALDIVSPLPTSASVVVLAAAIRGYTNITGAVQEATGPSTVQHATPGTGVFLTKAERAALRRAAGQGGAFTIDPLAGRTYVEILEPQISEDPFGDLIAGALGGAAVDPEWGWS